MYRNFLESEKVQELLNSTKSPLAALTVLKKICDHPTLLQNYKVFSAALNGNDGADDNGDDDDGDRDGGSGGGSGGGGGRDETTHDPCASPQARTRVMGDLPLGGLITPARSLVRRAVGAAAGGGSCDNAPTHTMTSRNKGVEQWGALADAVVKESGKLQFTLELLQRLHHEKHRCYSSLHSFTEFLLRSLTRVCRQHHHECHHHHRFGRCYHCVPLKEIIIASTFSINT